MGKGVADTGLWRCAHECGHRNGDGQGKNLKNIMGIVKLIIGKLKSETIKSI